MKKILASLLAGIMMLVLTACGNSTQAESASGNDGGTSRNTNIQTETSASLENTEQNVSQADNSTQPEQTERDSNLLVAYFSLAGEQYGVV